MSMDQAPAEERAEGDQADGASETMEKGNFHPPVEGLATGDGGTGEGGTVKG